MGELIFFSITILLALCCQIKVKLKKYSSKILFLGMILGGLSWIDLDAQILTGIIFVKRFIFLSYLLVWWVCFDYLKYKKYDLLEFFALYLISFIGIAFMFSCSSFQHLYFGMEICRYSYLFLVLYKKNSEKTDKYSLKFLLIEFISTALFVFGISVLYIQVGTLNYDQFQNLPENDIITFAKVLIFISFLIKIGGLPFYHVLIERMSVAPTCLLSIECSIIQPVFILVFSKVIFIFFDLDKYPIFFNLLGFSYLLYSSIQLLNQNNLRKITGCLLLYFQGLSWIFLGTQNYKALIIFCVFQSLSFVGFTTVQCSLRYEGKTLDDIRDLGGFGLNKFFLGSVWGIILLGMVSMPPLSGFWMHFLILKILVFQGKILSVVLLILATLLPIYAFIKFLKQMYVGKNKGYEFTFPFSYKIIFLISISLNMLMPFLINYFENLIKMEV